MRPAVPDSIVRPCTVQPPSYLGAEGLPFRAVSWTRARAGNMIIRERIIPRVMTGDPLEEDMNHGVKRNAANGTEETHRGTTGTGGAPNAKAGRESRRSRLLDMLRIIDGEAVQRGLPVIVGIGLVYAATLLTTIGEVPMDEWAAVFTGLFVAHVATHLLQTRFFRDWKWLYFVIQGGIILSSAIVFPAGREIVLDGLVPIMIFQGMVIYRESMKVLTCSLAWYAFFCGTILLSDGPRVLLRSLPILIVVTIAIRAYSVFYIREVNLRIRSQQMMRELEVAREQVAALTLQNERQRVAQDLHDTLSQGLAGLILQLDAADAHLERQNTERAREIIGGAMTQARRTLAETRLVIEDLRFSRPGGFALKQAVEAEIEAFRTMCPTETSVRLDIPDTLPDAFDRHVPLIVREGLGNVARHAQARHCAVVVRPRASELLIEIEDDGIGFDAARAEMRTGHFGLAGMRERADSLGGQMEIVSRKRSGTMLRVRLPMRREGA